MEKLICLVLLLILFMGCEEKGPEFNPPYDMSQVWEVHHQTAWDSLSTAQHLVGKWKWNYNFCCGFGTQGGSFTYEKNFVVQFFYDGTLEVFEQNISKQKSTWHLRIEDADLYGIVADPFVNQLYGRIFFTENGLLLNDSYRDAADNYFIRIE